MNFQFYVPTKILFGEGQEARFAKEVKKWGDSALMVYGGGSVKRNGIYDAIAGPLREAGIRLVDFGGVEPNPRVESVRQGVELARREGVQVVIPIGGGSTIDAAKAIAAGVKTQVDPWEFVSGKVKVEEALPILSVLTLAATGSEMDSSSVITNPETREKLGWSSKHVLPKVSLMNPAYTTTVSPYQTAAGTADIMSHTMENYFSVDTGAFMQDTFSEGILETCIQYGPVALKEPENLEARGNLMWAGSWAINGLTKTGKSQAWSVHPMEHELSAFYDITHGVGLALLTPPWLSHILSEKTAPRIARFGRRLFGLEGEDMAVAREAIQKLHDFFVSMDIPMSLKEVGIGEEHLEEMARACMDHCGGSIDGFVPLNEEDVLAIYRAAL